MNNNIYCRYAGITYKKSPGFSIAYAIVALVVVGVVLAGLTPVLTRKLPNLSTSSIIKNPKGWYESFYAPTVGARYCKTCEKEENEYNKCLEEQKKNPDKVCKEPDIIPSLSDYEKVTDKHKCFGNPACIPYVHPDDINPENPEKNPPKVIPFEQYCKSNGKCKPDPETPDDDFNDDKDSKDVCQKANDWNQTNKEYKTANPKPCPCPKGKCKFKPQTGITKYEVYAIGGGGCSGSAIASDPSSLGDTYKNSVTGTFRGKSEKLPIGSRITGIKNDLSTPTTNDGTFATFDVNKADEVKSIVTSDEKFYPKANFIDQNRIETTGNPYNPDHFSGKEGNVNYTNVLKLSDSDARDQKCATGIIYTVGKTDNNFHTYPTEDNNSVLAESSKRQIKRILGSRSYLIGTRSVPYYNRYYLYTRYLGAYAYNQNPVYLLMPEWVKVDNLDKKFPSGENGIDTAEILLEKEKIKSNEVTCINQTAIPYTFINNKGKKETRKTDVCNISYIKPNEFPKKDHTGADSPKAILSDYSITAGVACSGNGSSGANVIAKTNDVCEWMKPSACEYNQNDLKYEEVAANTITYDSCSAKCPGSTSAPSKNEKGNYCYKDSSRALALDKGEKTTCVGKTCNYNKYFINRECVYKQYQNSYVTCTCDNIELKPNCKDNRDSVELCTDTPITLGNDPNLENSRENWKGFFDNNLEDAINSDIVMTNSNGDEEIYSVTSNGYVIHKGTDKVIGRVDINKKIDAIVNNALTAMAAHFTKSHPEDSADQANMITNNGGGTPVCTLNKPYVRYAYGGAKGKGVCGYKMAKIARNALNSVELYKEDEDGNKKPCLSGTGRDANKVGIHSECGTRTNGNIGQKVYVCINNNCAIVSGGNGGQGGKVECHICTGKASNGKKGEDGTVDNGGYFSIKDKGESNLDYVVSALVASSSNNNVEKNSNNNNDNNKVDNVKTYGTQKTPGRYNYRYIWYMPFVTKHLMFGLAGEGGEEVHSLVTLSEGQTLDVIPGKGAVKTEYKSGVNGGNGGQSEVRSDDAKVKIVAHGGKGGLGSQKTDEYVLCHISDLQNQNPNLPCYYTKDKNDFKSTHATTPDGKFVGILATQPKESTTVNSIKMSANLKDGTPGMGAMGFGTKSVSDVICNKRHVAKWDQINGSDKATDDNVISSGGTLYNVCKGNSKIKYIIPNGSKYTAGTGAVIIIW